MTDYTPTQRIWKSFKRNKLALAGSIFIAFTILAALLAYVIMPDDSPDANNMTLQLSIKRPGAVFKLLLIRKSRVEEQPGFFAGLLFGKPARFNSVPITGYHFKGDSIEVEQYIGDEDKPDRAAFHLVEVLNGKKQITPILNETLRARYRKAIIENQIVRKKYWLGTDIYGRDLLSRLILGSRVSLAVGLVAVIISLVLGVIIGSAAGFYGGKTDAALSWLMNVLWALPALLLVIAISFALGKGLWQIFVAVGLSMWVDVARLVRGQVMAVKQFEFVEAARALGYTNYRIIRHHILPNIMGPILVVASSNFASAIILEAGLSFLGFGAQPPTPTWGEMIKEHYGYIVMDAAYLAILPGLAIMLIVYAFNLVTIGLRDAFDVKAESTRI